MQGTEFTLPLQALAALEAWFPLTPQGELAILVAAVVTLCGVWICWQAPYYRMQVEERAKDGKLTEEQARRRVTHSSWVGPAVVFIGMTALCWAFLI
jgi:hypothetical protein